MKPSAKAVLAVFHDIAQGHRDATLDWYDREHHAERVDLPGFLSARRYMALDGAPELFNRYETTGLDVLSSRAYVECLNTPTSGTLQAQPTFRNMSRTVCRIAGRAGRAEGGVVAALRVKAPNTSAAADAVRWDDAAGDITGRWGILSAELWIADDERSTIPSEEKTLRGQADHVASAIVVVHGTGEQAVRNAVGDPAAFADRLGLGGFDAHFGVFALAFALDAG